MMIVALITGFFGGILGTMVGTVVILFYATSQLPKDDYDSEAF